MRIRLHNVFGFPFAIIGLVWGIMMHRHIGVFFSVIKTLGPTYYPPDQVMLGCIAFMVIFLSCIALIKIIFDQGSQN